MSRCILIPADLWADVVHVIILCVPCSSTLLSTCHVKGSGKGTTGTIVVYTHYTCRGECHSSKPWPETTEFPFLETHPAEWTKVIAVADCWVWVARPLTVGMMYSRPQYSGKLQYIFLALKDDSIIQQGISIKPLISRFMPRYAQCIICVPCFYQAGAVPPPAQSRPVLWPPCQMCSHCPSQAEQDCDSICWNGNRHHNMYITITYTAISIV